MVFAVVTQGAEADLELLAAAMAVGAVTLLLIRDVRARRVRAHGHVLRRRRNDAERP